MLIKFNIILHRLFFFLNFKYLQRNLSFKYWQEKHFRLLLVDRNWFLGKRIAEKELKDSRKDNYGKEIIN